MSKCEWVEHDLIQLYIAMLDRDTRVLTIEYSKAIPGFTLILDHPSIHVVFLCENGD
jgi:hypothetical protein